MSTAANRSAVAWHEMKCNHDNWTKGEYWRHNGIISLMSLGGTGTKGWGSVQFSKSMRILKHVDLDSKYIFTQTTPSVTSARIPKS